MFYENFQFSRSVALDNAIFDIFFPGHAQNTKKPRVGPYIRVS